MKTRQLYNTTWIPFGEYEYDICCNCGLKHRVFIRWNKRKHRLEERWAVVPNKRRTPRDKKSDRH